MELSNVRKKSKETIKCEKKTVTCDIKTTSHSTVPLIFLGGTVPTQIYTINWCYFNRDR